MASTTELLKLPIWAPGAYPEDGSPEARIGTSYNRAKTVAKHVNMCIEDITNLTPKFWAYHTDCTFWNLARHIDEQRSTDLILVITAADTAVTTILTIHWNLCMGTIASYASNEPALLRILDELQRFESVGEFMLTEVGHGLDARNIETTATLNEDGSFDFHTPTPAAAKIMPPTTPHAGMPRLAVVFAQLIVRRERRGVRPFVVRINSAESMAPGVVSRLLPMRPGAKMVDHAITTFHHVRLESWALLGGIEAPENTRKDFFRHIHRVTIGTLSLSMTNVIILRLSGYILGRYSQRRTVAGPNPDERVPIITFSTQHTPIISALAFSYVLEAYSRDVCKTFLATKEPQIRSGLACIFKQTAQYATQTLANELIDRCGWQGLYTHNQLIELVLTIRGNSIAEGDSLVLCIRLVSELLLGRYEVPKARDPKCLLAQHEASIWKEASSLSRKIMITAGSNRNEKFNTVILPRCRKLVQAIGHRMAYEAAAASDLVNPDMLKLYEITCMLEDPSWYVEHKKFSTSDLYKRHAEAVKAIIPSLETMLQKSGAAPWATAPILKEETWMDFIERLPAFTHDGSAPLFPSSESSSETASIVTEKGTASLKAGRVTDIKTGDIGKFTIERKTDPKNEFTENASQKKHCLFNWLRSCRQKFSCFSADR